MPPSTPSSSPDPVGFSLESNGQPIDVGAQTRSMQLGSVLGSRATLRLVLVDDDVTTGGWSAADSSQFQLGASLRLSVGYGAELSPLFEGVVVQRGLRTSEASATCLVVQARAGAEASGAESAASLETVLRVGWGVDLLEFEGDADAVTTAWPLAPGWARTRGRMKFRGSAAATVGSVIEVYGLAASFSGKVLVSAIEHTIADGNWLTTVEFGLAAS